MGFFNRSEEHTSELQSHDNLVCRLLLEKKKERNMAGKRIRREELSDRGSCTRGTTSATEPPPSPANRAISGNRSLYELFFFFNDAATPETYTLSLPDPLPI